MIKIEHCINEKDKCFCMKMRECKDCTSQENIKDGKCILPATSFCTCRLCGKATRFDGYKYEED